jgi:hypothetical protein
MKKLRTVRSLLVRACRAKASASRRTFRIAQQRQHIETFY